MNSPRAAGVPAEPVQLSEALSRYREVELPAQNKSEATRRGYLYDLAEWLRQLSVTSVQELDIGTIDAYLATLDRRGLKGTTRRRKMAAISHFLTFCEEKLHALPEGFHHAVVWPKATFDEPRQLSETQYTALLQEARGHPRDYAILEILLQTGIRLSELTALQITDIDLPATPSPDLTHGYGELRVMRKGRRLQMLTLNYKACEALKNYLRVRPKSKASALFLTKYGEPITNRSVQKAFKKYAVAAGIPWAHPHNLRVTHITQHLARGTDIKTVQGNAGHASLETTNHYAAYVKKAQIKAMQEHAL